jgi:hypothetical protein
MDGPVHFLDIDLDAFLDGIANWRANSRRLSKRYYRSWTADQLREFLETRCGLRTDTRIPGLFAIEHDAVFNYWKQIAQETKEALDIVHIDGHADLGMGSSSWIDIVTLLRLPVESRLTPRSGPRHLNAGSYLAYALAARLVRSLTYVYPKGHGDDIFGFYFERNDPSTNHLQLKTYSEDVIQQYCAWGSRELRDEDAMSVEPRVPLTKRLLTQFTAPRKFQYVFLCQSPGFTPKTSDELIPTFEEYIDFEQWPAEILKARTGGSTAKK